MQFVPHSKHTTPLFLKANQLMLHVKIFPVGAEVYTDHMCCVCLCAEYRMF